MEKILPTNSQVPSIIFGVWDYLAVVFTFAVTLIIGGYVGLRKAKTDPWSSLPVPSGTQELLMGNRKMRPVSIAVSMLVTYFSAIAIISYPAEIFANGIKIFFMNLILSVVCISSSVFIFVIVLHKLKLTSVYEYLELRFSSKLVRQFASFIFILETTLITGLALYAPAIPLQRFIGLPVSLSIVIVGLVGSLYTSVGGLKAVVATDCFQFFLIMGGMLAIIVRGASLAGGVGQVFQTAYDTGRLNFFDGRVDFFENYNTLNICIGYGLSLIWFYGAHQPNFQRYSSLPTLKLAFLGMLYNVLFQELAFIFIILTGIVIVGVYVNCDPMLLGTVGKQDEIVPFFVQENLAYIPGMMGLFVSCVLCAALSTISSALNSLAAVVWEDFLSNLSYFKKLNSTGQRSTTIALSFIFGFIVICVALLASMSSSIFQTSIVVMGSSAGTVGGAFILALFVPLANKVGVSVGMLAGLLSTAFLGLNSLTMKLPSASLKTSIKGCANYGNDTFDVGLSNGPFSVNEQPTFEQHTMEYPQKLLTISVVLYPVIGAVITSIVGAGVSLIASYFKWVQTEIEKDDMDKYLHPLVLHLLKRNGSGESNAKVPFNKIEGSTNMENEVEMKPLPSGNV